MILYHIKLLIQNQTLNILNIIVTKYKYITCHIYIYIYREREREREINEEKKRKEKNSCHMWVKQTRKNTLLKENNNKMSYVSEVIKNGFRKKK